MNQESSSIERLKLHGVDALAKLFIANRGNLKNLVAGRIGKKLAARFDESDVVQEVFIRAKRQLNNYLDSPQIHPVIWLRILTKQLLAEEIRKNMRAIRSPEFEVKNSGDQLIVERIADSLHSVNELIERKEMIRIVQDLMADLSELDRSIVEMRHTESLTFGEIADLLEIKMEATKKRYYRTLGRLKSLCDARSV